MSSLLRQEQLRSVLQIEQERIRQAFPAHDISTLAALTRARDWRFLTAQQFSLSPPISSPATHAPGFSLFASGWLTALEYCLDPGSPAAPPLSPDTPLDAWADQVLSACDALAMAEQVLAYCESGFLKMQQGGQKDFFAWIASKKMPTEWREREDIAWWTGLQAASHAQEVRALTAEKLALQPLLDAFAARWHPDQPVYTTTYALDAYYRRLGLVWVKCMACHLLYPAETRIAGATIELYREVLALLIAYALKHLDISRAYVARYPALSVRALLATPHDVGGLSEAVSETLGVEEVRVRVALDAYGLQRANVQYHSSFGDTPAPPLLRCGEQFVWSLPGLLREPCFFLTRELRRLASQEYHTASHVREAVFRQDLYELFADKRFVKSSGRVELRGRQGELATDVDALIFDRKTGALALFELKSQDPFAYSREERRRQRDYFYQATKQVLACQQWLSRYGADALLTRLNVQQLKRFKVQKTYMFVLGRYLAHFFDGPAFDQRAAWGTWPQVLRLLNALPFGAEDAQPFQTLYNRLARDTPLVGAIPDFEVWKIEIGEAQLYIYHDFELYRRTLRRDAL